MVFGLQLWWLRATLSHMIYTCSVPYHYFNPLFHHRTTCLRGQILQLPPPPNSPVFLKLPQLSSLICCGQGVQVYLWPIRSRAVIAITAVSRGKNYLPSNYLCKCTCVRNLVNITSGTVESGRHFKFTFVYSDLQMSWEFRKTSTPLCEINFLSVCQISI